MHTAWGSTSASRALSTCAAVLGTRTLAKEFPVCFEKRRFVQRNEASTARWLGIEMHPSAIWTGSPGICYRTATKLIFEASESVAALIKNLHCSDQGYIVSIVCNQTIHTDNCKELTNPNVMSYVQLADLGPANPTS